MVNKHLNFIPDIPTHRLCKSFQTSK